jgi:hypothetical protein
MSRNSGMTTDGLLGALTSKPEGLLLLAAGVALMLRSGVSAPSRPSATRGNDNRAARRRQAAQSRDHEDDDSNWNFGEGISEGISQATGKARDIAGKAREYVSDVTDRTVETAGAYASSVSDSMSDYAHRARRGVVDGSGQFAETFQQTVQRVVREQPLSVALVGLAAGAAVAAAFPATEVEGRMFGPAKQKLADAVGQASEQLKSAGAQAGERLAEVAEERGLNRDGLKEAARDVADAFKGALSGDGDQSKPANASNAKTSSGTTNGKPSSGTPNGSSGSTPPVSFGP